MLKKALTVTVAVCALFVASYVLGAFGTAQAASPCACCEVCACDVCACEALGCECDTGGDCFCTNACHKVCCDN